MTRFPITDLVQLTATRNYSCADVVWVDDMRNHEIQDAMNPDAAARQALRVALAEVLVVAENWRHIHLDAKPGADTAEAAEVLSQILGMLAERARGALEADGAEVDALVEWALADIADELT